MAKKKKSKKVNNNSKNGSEILNGVGWVEVGGEGVRRSDGVGLGGRGSDVGSRNGGGVGWEVGWGREGGGRILRTYKAKTNTHATINVK